MRMHPINPAETVIAPFFDKDLFNPAEWSLKESEYVENLSTCWLYNASISWDKAQAQKEIATWQWAGKLDVSGYDGFFLQASISSWVILEFSVKVDGLWQMISTKRGCGAHEEYEGDFKGNNLEGIKLTFISLSDTAGAFNSYYLGVYNKKKLKDWLDYENPQIGRASCRERV